MAAAGSGGAKARDEWIRKATDRKSLSGRQELRTLNVIGTMRASKPKPATAKRAVHHPFPRNVGRVGAWQSLAVVLALFALGLQPIAVQAAPKSPNILFIIMADVGIDQMKTFGYGGETPPSTPNIDTIANAGIRFSNTWSMPACSTSRAVFFTGRFPLRTNVYGALGPDDLANAQVSRPSR
ncbi:MAG: hypothetical protein EXR85_00080 [Xanthomonadales bacterium]|nr:hypothetical protein [Xanthomonadales bacterium]